MQRAAPSHYNQHNHWTQTGNLVFDTLQQFIRTLKPRNGVKADERNEIFAQALNSTPQLEQSGHLTCSTFDNLVAKCRFNLE
jgi:hypothetical protein